jgi:hypothetical protein
LSSKKLQWEFNLFLRLSASQRMGQDEAGETVEPLGLAALLSQQDKKKISAIFSPIKGGHDSPHREPIAKPWVLANLMAKRAAIQRVHAEREHRRITKEETMQKMREDEMRARKEKAAQAKREAKRVAKWDKAAKKKESTVKKAVAKATEKAQKKAREELAAFKEGMDQKQKEMNQKASQDAKKQIDYEIKCEQKLKGQMDHRMRMTSTGDGALAKSKVVGTAESTNVFTQQFFEYAHPFPEMDPLVKPRPERPASPSVASRHRQVTKKKMVKEKVAHDQRLEAFEKSMKIGEELAKIKKDNQKANRRNIEKVHTIDLMQKERQLAVTLDHMKGHAQSEVELIRIHEMKQEEERLAHIAGWEVEQAHRLALQKANRKEEHDRQKANKRATKVASSRKAKQIRKERDFFDTSQKMFAKASKSTTKDEERRQQKSDSMAERKNKLLEEEARRRSDEDVREAQYQADLERGRRIQVQETWAVQDKVRARMLDLAEPNKPGTYSVNQSRVDVQLQEDKKSVEFRKQHAKRSEDAYKTFEGEEGRLIKKWQDSTVVREESMRLHAANKKKMDDERTAKFKEERLKRDEIASAAQKRMGEIIAATHDRKEADLKADQAKIIASQKKAAKLQKAQVEAQHKKIKESEHKFAHQKSLREKLREKKKLELMANMEKAQKLQIERMRDRKPYQIPEAAKPKKTAPFVSPYILEKSKAKELMPYQHYVGGNSGNKHYEPPRPTTR